jgi:hypothetical protein
MTKDLVRSPYNQERSLQVIRFPITKEITNDQDSQHKKRDHEDLKVQIHRLSECPAYEDDQGCIEESGLDRGA